MFLFKNSSSTRVYNYYLSLFNTTLITTTPQTPNGCLFTKSRAPFLTGKTQLIFWHGWLCKGYAQGFGCPGQTFAIVGFLCFSFGFRGFGQFFRVVGFGRVFDPFFRSNQFTPRCQYFMATCMMRQKKINKIVSTRTP